MNQEGPWRRSPIGITTLGFIAVAGFFLLTEHTARIRRIAVSPDPDVSARRASFPVNRVAVR